MSAAVTGPRACLPIRPQLCRRVDPTLPERQLEDALCAAIADRHGHRGDRWVGDDGLWLVESLSPVWETFGGTMMAQAAGCCLVGVIGWTGEIGDGTAA